VVGLKPVIRSTLPRFRCYGALVLVEPETEWKDGGSVLARAVEFKAALSTAAQGARDWLNPLPFVR
jgi:hypothetical protein